MLICVFLHQLEDCPNFRKVFCRQIKFIDIAEFGAFFLVIRTLIQSMHDFPRTTLRSRGDRPFRFFSFLTITLRANQNVTGLAMTTFGVGFGNFMGGSLIKLTGSEVPSIALSATNSYFAKTIPGVERLGWFGKIFLSYGFLAYLAVAIALIAAYVLKRTRVGLHLRAVGENPQTADAAGIDVNKYKYIATCVGSMIAGLGGLYYVMDYACGVWSNDAFGDRGWLAIALVIFTVWKPNVGVLASFLFGGLYILHIFLPSGTNLAVKELYKMIPYVVTIIVLIITSVRSKRENQPPASLGLPYFREER